MRKFSKIVIDYWHIRGEVGAGVPFPHAFEAAKRYATLEELTFRYKFNGIEITVTKDSTYEQAVETYESGLEEQREADYAS